MTAVKSARLGRHVLWIVGHHRRAFAGQTLDRRHPAFRPRFNRVTAADERAFLAALTAETTNLGSSRMAEVCGAGSSRALLRMQTWHMREETFCAALACLTDAIHAEPIAAWFGQGHRASADGQAFYLGGRREAGGAVNAHYGRDPVVKIYATITDRYAPLYQTLIAGTAGEDIHALDGILGHESNADLTALHAVGKLLPTSCSRPCICSGWTSSRASPVCLTGASTLSNPRSVMAGLRRCSVTGSLGT